MTYPTTEQGREKQRLKTVQAEKDSKRALDDKDETNSVTSSTATVGIEAVAFLGASVFSISYLMMH